MKIVINGCFDLLHKAHICLIHRALKYSDSGKVLILINSNDSVKRLKGEQHPIDDVTIRGENIQIAYGKWCQKKLEYPKLTIQVFDTEKELEEAIDRFEPDIIMKGIDRPDVREIVGYNKWPILMVPPPVNKDGSTISSTAIARERGLIWDKK